MIDRDKTCPDCKGSGSVATRGTSSGSCGVERAAVVCTNSWAGYVETPVKVLLQTSTPKRYRVRYLESAVRRRAGEVVLVPKYAVRFTDGEPDAAKRFGVEP